MPAVKKVTHMKFCVCLQEVFPMREAFGCPNKIILFL